MSANAQTFGMSPPLYQNYEVHSPFANLAAFKGTGLVLHLKSQFQIYVIKIKVIKINSIKINSIKINSNKINEIKNGCNES